MLFVRLDRPCWNFHRMSFRETRPTAPEFPPDATRETRPTAPSNPPSCFTPKPDTPSQTGCLTTPISATAEHGAARAQRWNERQTPKCRWRSARRKHAP